FQIVEARRAGDAGERLVLRPGLELALGDEPLEGRAEPPEPAPDELVAGLDEEHRAPRLRRDLDDAAAHEAAADDAHVLDGHDVAGGGAASSCGRGDPAGTVARNAGRPAGTGSAPCGSRPAGRSRGTAGPGRAATRRAPPRRSARSAAP